MVARPRCCVRCLESAFPISTLSTINHARAKRTKRDKFDLTEAVHKSEYTNLAKPIGKKSHKPIEPAHKFEVTLESDKFTPEK